MDELVQRARWRRKARLRAVVAGGMAAAAVVAIVASSGRWNLSDGQPVNRPAPTAPTVTETQRFQPATSALDSPNWRTRRTYAG